MSPPPSDSLPDFGRQFFGAQDTFTRIGAGQIGGKAAGLDLIRSEILPAADVCGLAGIDVAVPTLTILTTEIFDHFLERNNLRDLAFSDESDERIALGFQQASLPAEYIGDLRALIKDIHTPLAIRSSSLLEDVLEHPFAGVYGTKMIPNNQADIDTRFQRLVEAIKYVYASTFFRGARSYLRSVKQPKDAERMAVIIQEVVGRRYNDRFYPFLSGVARSYNYYPSGHAAPEDGVVNLALGLGKQIVDGGISWTYSPAYPQMPPPYGNINELLKNSQVEFWAINMGRPPLHDPIRETEYLARAGIADAEFDGSLDLLVSTYDGRSDRLRAGLIGSGPRVLDFAPILSCDALPLNEVVRRLLATAERVVGSPVEIEFAVKPGDTPHDVAHFGFLQVRPMMVSAEEIVLAESEMAAPDVLLASDAVLGNGTENSVQDVVFVKPDSFNARHTMQMADEIEGLNRALLDEGRPYLLIGFGRWGSSDPWLGIPVDWGQISGVRVLVETTLPEMNPDLSQGSHFFHNLIGFRVLYLSLKHGGPHRVDWEWLTRQQVVRETEHVRHVRCPAPLHITVDGRRRRGVIRRGA